MIRFPLHFPLYAAIQSKEKQKITTIINTLMNKLYLYLPTLPHECSSCGGVSNIRA